MLKNYLKTAWRNLSRSRLHSLINIAGLSLGMAVAVLIGLWIYDEISFNKNFTHYDRIAQVIQNVTNNGEVQTWKEVPYPLAEELRKNYGSDFKQVILAASWGDHILTIGEKKFKDQGSFFEQGAPDMFSLQMVKGSRSSLNDPASVLMSASAAAGYFGKDDPINKTISIDGAPPVKVTGVYLDFPLNSTFSGMHFMSTWDHLFNTSDGYKNMEDPWRPNAFRIYVRLQDNADFAQVSARIKDAKLHKVNSQLAKKKPALFLHPMADWHLYSEFKNGVNTGGAIQFVWMFGIIGVFVLLLACINFMNLSTARSERRAKEVGIRKAIGSRKWQLVLQFFGESLLTVIFAFAFSLLVVQLALPFFNQVADKHVSILWDNPFFWGSSLAFVVSTALVAASYPAFYLSSFQPIKALKGTFKASSLAAIPRKILVVVQFTVSVTLIIGTIIVFKQIQFAKNRPVGYSRNNLVTIPTMNPSIHDHFNAVRHALLATGAITELAESQSPTTAIWNSTSGFSWPEKDPNLSVDFGVATVSYDYGKTIGWFMQEGRDFSRDFATDSSAIILNQAAVRYMGLKHPIGEQVSWWGHPCTVIGVIQNMVIESPYDEARPVIYDLNNEAANMVILKLNPALSASDALSKIEPIFKRFNPDQPFEFQFVDDDYAKKFTDEERMGKLASVFSVLAILISCLGLFGLTSFVAEQRTKEISVRKVLGASVFNLWKLLSLDFTKLVIISFLISVPLSYYWMSVWLKSYSYRTTLSWWIFALACLGSLAVTVLVVSIQVIKAAMVNPASNLRTE